MTTWTNDELNKIERTEELQVSSLRKDGSMRNPVTVWVVRVGDDVYVRSTNGRTASWFCGVQDRYEGHIRVGGIDKDVIFVEETDPNVNDQIDQAYRTKYRRYANIASHMTDSGPRSATVKLVPNSRDS
jgi:hypothetical protein